MSLVRGLRYLGPPLLLSLAIHAGVLTLSSISRRGEVATGAAPLKHPPGSAPIDVALAGRKSDVQKSPARPSADRAIPEAAAIQDGPTSALGTASVGSAPPATSGASDGALNSYAALVRERISSVLRYPLALQRRGVRGHVGLRLTLDADGRVQAQEITQRSEGPDGEALDQVALEAVHEAEPFPKPPGALTAQGPLVLNLPLEFKLKH